MRRRSRSGEAPRDGRHRGTARRPRDHHERQPAHRGSGAHSRRDRGGDAAGPRAHRGPARGHRSSPRDRLARRRDPSRRQGTRDVSDPRNGAPSVRRAGDRSRDGGTSWMSAPFWTLDRVAAALRDTFAAEGARTRWPRGPTTLRGVSTDTRQIQVGDLFVALGGERFDAHDFLTEAVGKGAASLIVSKPERTTGLGVPVFTVPDTTVGLGGLGRFRRRAWGKPLVAITGTNGKTSTKDLARAALGAALDVHATTGNLNNRKIGRASCRERV